MLKNRYSWLGVLIALWVLFLTACGDSMTPTSSSVPATQPDLTLPLTQKWEFKANGVDHFLQNIQLSSDQKSSYWIESGSDNVTDLIALDNNTGSQKWRYNLAAYNFKAGEYLQLSSQVDTDTLYLSFVYSKDGTVLAFEATTGKLKWEFKLEAGKTFLGQPLFWQGGQLIEGWS